MTPGWLAVVPSLGADVDVLRRLLEDLRAAGTEPYVAPTGLRLESALVTAGLPVLPIGANPGFGETVRRAANQLPWQWLLIVNDDITFEPEELGRHLSEQTGAAGDTRALVFLDPTPARRIPGVWSVFQQLSLLGAVTTRRRTPATSSPTAATHFGPFSLVLIGRDLWDELDGFDPALVYTFEDADFSRRATGSGARVRFTTSHGTKHAASSTSRRHVDHVLPVAAWSAQEYLAKWNVPHPVATAVCVAALALRVLTVPVAPLDRRSHLRGIGRAIVGLLRRRPPALTPYESA